MSSLHGARRSVSLTVRGLSLRRFSSTSLPYVSEEGKSNVTGERNPPDYDTHSFVHPSAIVHPNAVLGQGVSIGPFCTVGPLAKLGNNCQLFPGSHIFGSTDLGNNCFLMTASCCDWSKMPRHEIQGDNNEIREHTSIHRSSKPSDKTVIGDNNLIMGSCHIAHDCKVGSNNIFANNTLLAGHVVVEDYSHTAGATVVHQFCRIGSYSFIGGGSVISQDVPRYMMVSGERAELRGLNLEGLRRRGFSVTELRSLKAAYRKIFMAIDAKSASIEDRLIKVEQDEELAAVPAVCSMLQSIRESFAEDRRGICKFRCWSGT